MKHLTHNTVSASKWCKQCSRFTQHHVSAGKVMHCLECPAPAAAAAPRAGKKKPVQIGFDFSGGT